MNQARFQLNLIFINAHAAEELFWLNPLLIVAGEFSGKIIFSRAGISHGDIPPLNKIAAAKHRPFFWEDLGDNVSNTREVFTALQRFNGHKARARERVTEQR